MTDIKSKVQGLEANIEAQSIKKFIGDASSVYEALAVISKRADQISIDLKHELTAKLEEFAETSDTIEEIHENKEQIEISKFYERLPNPVLIAATEFKNGEISYRYKDSNA
ncbi:MAG TPA: DNA-directed RNA polymerase subunit omega [Phaeodactylibacter sp.]|nr:DNA-directed RNA polymerase subunit omega [Phaeodactylibacter sp.]